MMRVYGNAAARAALLAIVFVLSACGGGGGGGSDRPAGTFTLATDTLTFSTDRTSITPAAQTLGATFTGVDASQLIVRIEVAGPALATVHDIQATSDTTGSVSVVPASAALLGPGTYSGTITVFACTSDPTCATRQLAGSPKVVNVTYTVAGIAATPTFLDFGTIRDSGTAADRTRSVILKAFPSQSFTTSVSSSLSSIVQVSGATGSSAAGTLDISLIDTELLKLPSGSYSGAVTLTPSTVGEAVLIPISFNLQRTQVDIVTPFVAVPFESFEVIIRGANFDSTRITGVKFGAADATSFRVVSPTEIRATFPQLTPGTYPIGLVGQNALIDARLTIVGASQFLVQKLSVPSGHPRDILYDAIRGTLYVAVDQPPGTQDTIDRYDFNFGGLMRRTVFFDANDRIVVAPSANETNLLFGGERSDSTTLLTYQPVVTGLADVGFVFNGIIGPDLVTNYVKDIATANDGNAILVTAADAGSLARGAFLYPSKRAASFSAFPSVLPLVPAGDPGNSNPFIDGVAGASGNGSRVLIASSPAATGSFLYQYDASTGVLSSTGQNLTADAIQLDRTGNRILLSDSRVYTADFQLIGQLPVDTRAAVLSPDGSKVYTYNSSAQVLTFDITGSSLQLLSNRASQGTAGATQRGVMTITPDGVNLFIAVDGEIIVATTPQPSDPFPL